MIYSHPERQALLDRVFEKHIRHAGGGVHKASQLIAHLPAMHHRFMNTPLLPGTEITPANLLAHSEPLPGAVRASVLRAAGRNETLSFDYTTHLYTIEDHPVISDLKKLLEIMAIPRDLDAYAQWADDLFLSQFHIPDIDYVDFLLNTALRLDLLEEMPSLYTSMFRAVSPLVAAGFFKQPPADMLLAVVDATLEDCADQLAHLMPHLQIPPSVFRQTLYDLLHLDALRGVLRLSLSTDAKPSRLRVLDNDFPEGALDPAAMNSLMQQVYLSSVFTQGITLDKFFITPFSLYLRLIQPFYYPELTPPQMLRFSYQALHETGSPETALYSPEAVCFHTPLGCALLGLEKPNTPPASIDLSLAFADIDAWVHNVHAKVLYKKTPAKIDSGENVYTLTAVCTENESHRARIAVASGTTLAELHKQLYLAFRFCPSTAYSFFGGMTQSPFIEYRGNDNARRKSTQTAFGDFCPASSAFLFIAHDSSNADSRAARQPLHIALTVESVCKRTYGQVYPKTLG